VERIGVVFIGIALGAATSRAISKAEAAEVIDNTKGHGMFEYWAKVERWVNGDTVDVTIDLGFCMRAYPRLRLARVDTHETNQTASRDAEMAARKFVENLVPVGSTVIVKIFKTGKCGRYVAEVEYPMDLPGDDGGPHYANLSDTVLANGHGGSHD
jgi:micrococcal nuclease